MQPPSKTDTVPAFAGYCERLAEFLKPRLAAIPRDTGLACVDDVVPNLGRLQAQFDVVTRQEIAFDAALNAKGDLNRMAQAYGIQRDELDILLQHDPVVQQSTAHILKQVAEDPAAATRLRARGHLDTLLGDMAIVAASKGNDAKDRIAAFKALASVANVEADAKAKTPVHGAKVTVNFGVLTPAGMRSATVIEAA
jgi:hypothetical protein